MLSITLLSLSVGKGYNEVLSGLAGTTAGFGTCSLEPSWLFARDVTELLLGTLHHNHNRAVKLICRGVGMMHVRVRWGEVVGGLVCDLVSSIFCPLHSQSKSAQLDTAANQGTGMTGQSFFAKGRVIPNFSGNFFGDDLAFEI